MDGMMGAACGADVLYSRTTDLTPTIVEDLCHSTNMYTEHTKKSQCCMYHINTFIYKLLHISYEAPAGQTKRWRFWPVSGPRRLMKGSHSKEVLEL